MNILIVAATTKEIEPFIAWIRANKDQLESQSAIKIKYVITGLGMVNTMYALMQEVIQSSYDLMINAGIAGSFNSKIELGEVLRIKADQFADIGVRNAEDKFEDSFKLGWEPPNIFPYSEGLLHGHKAYNKNNLPFVIGLTVNTVTGSERSIAEMKINYPNCTTESMEGAAVFYIGIKENIPCIQLRAVSNYVEVRNISNWKIELAIENLNKELISLIEVVNDSLS